VSWTAIGLSNNVVRYMQSILVLVDFWLAAFGLRQPNFSLFSELGHHSCMGAGSGSLGLYVRS